LQKYPADLTINNESFWSGYRRAPTRMPFDASNEEILQCVSVLAKILGRMFNVDVGEIDVKSFKDLYSKPDTHYWDFVRVCWSSLC
jgi:hypothetical protein